MVSHWKWSYGITLEVWYCGSVAMWHHNHAELQVFVSRLVAGVILLLFCDDDVVVYMLTGVCISARLSRFVDMLCCVCVIGCRSHCSTLHTACDNCRLCVISEVNIFALANANVLPKVGQRAHQIAILFSVLSSRMCAAVF